MKRLILGLVLAFALAGGGLVFAQTNQPPQVLALFCPWAAIGESASDPDGDPLTYQWTVISAPAGSNYRFTEPNELKTKLCVDLPGVYEVQLIVSDGTDTTVDTVTLTLTQ